MTDDAAVRDEAWAHWIGPSTDERRFERMAFVAGWNARARHVPEPAVLTAERVKEMSMEQLISERDDARREVTRLMGLMRARPEPLRRVRHKKRGTTYTVLGEAEMQVSDGQDDPNRWPSRFVYDETTKLVVYQGEDDRLWARFPDEMWGGRFEDVAEPARHVPEPDRVGAALDAWLGHPHWRRDTIGAPHWRKRMGEVLAAADALAPPPAVPDEVRRAFIELGVVAEARDDTQWMAARDAYIRTIRGWVRSLLAAPAQPAEDEEIERLKRELRLWKDANHEANEIAGTRRVQRDALTRRIRDLEEALDRIKNIAEGRDALDAFPRSTSERLRRLNACAEVARAIIQGDDK
jgi:hypothetical protein